MSVTTCTLTLRAPTSDELDEAMIRALNERGYAVTKRIESYETPGAFSCRIGISVKTFSQRTRHMNCPAFVARRGASGRIIGLQSNDDLEEFLTANIR